MLHKIVEPGKADDKLNIFQKYFRYTCYQDKLDSYFSKLDMLQKRDYYYTGYIKGFGMVAAICRSEIAVIEKLQLVFKGQG